MRRRRSSVKVISERRPTLNPWELSEVLRCLASLLNILHNSNPLHTTGITSDEPFSINLYDQEKCVLEAIKYSLPAVSRKEHFVENSKLKFQGCKNILWRNGDTPWIMNLAHKISFNKKSGFSGLNPVSVPFRSAGALDARKCNLDLTSSSNFNSAPEASFLGIHQETFLCSSPISHKVRFPERGDEL